MGSSREVILADFRIEQLEFQEVGAVLLGDERQMALPLGDIDRDDLSVQW